MKLSRKLRAVPGAWARNAVVTLDLLRLKWLCAGKRMFRFECRRHKLNTIFFCCLTRFCGSFSSPYIPLLPGVWSSPGLTLKPELLDRTFMERCLVPVRSDEMSSVLEALWGCAKRSSWSSWSPITGDCLVCWTLVEFSCLKSLGGGSDPTDQRDRARWGLKSEAGVRGQRDKWSQI